MSEPAPGLRLVSAPRESLARLAELELHRRWVVERDEAAVAELWTRHQRLAVHLVARILHTRPDALSLARGVCDEAFVRALGTFQPGRAARVDQPFRAWFIRLARHAATDLARKRQVPTDPEATAAVWDDPAHSLICAAEVAQARAWVLEHFLPSDWGAIEQLAEGWSWAEIAANNPVVAPVEIRFGAGSAELTEPCSALDQVERVLRLAPKVRLRVVGLQAEAGVDAVPGLALTRAKAVRDALVHRLTAASSRLVVMAGEDGEGCRAVFEITEGATHSAAAQRMRLTSILGRYRSTGAR